MLTRSITITDDYSKITITNLESKIPADPASRIPDRRTDN